MTDDETTAEVGGTYLSTDGEVMLAVVDEQDGYYHFEGVVKKETLDEQRAAGRLIEFAEFGSMMTRMASAINEALEAAFGPLFEPTEGGEEDRDDA